MTRPIETFPNGVVVYPATSEPEDKSNIYCEFPWCSPDSSGFVYMRHAPGAAPNPWTLVFCEFGSWKKRVLGQSSGGMTMANGGRFYFQRTNTRGQRELVRHDFQTDHQAVIPLPDTVPEHARLDISPGECYVAYDQPLAYHPPRFAIGLADLHSGKCELIHEDPYICNTHHQFEPKEGRFLLVQHNRGCRFTPDGTMELLVGKEGATLFFLEIPDGKVHRVPVGPPHTYSISGHETWIGLTGEVLLTLNIQEDYDHGKGPIIGVRPDGTVRTICAPWQMNHIGIEPSGRIFCADTFAPDEIIIGSPRTHRAAVVCPAQTSYLRSRQRNAVQDSHPHAYISPDRKWVVFNSDRTGVQQIYCAAIPPAMVAELER